MRQRIRHKILNATTVLADLGHIVRTRPLTSSEHDVLRLKLKEIETSVDCTVTWDDVKGFFTRRVW